MAPAKLNTKVYLYFVLFVIFLSAVRLRVESAITDEAIPVSPSSLHVANSWNRNCISADLAALVLDPGQGNGKRVKFVDLSDGLQQANHFLSIVNQDSLRRSLAVTHAKATLLTSGVVTCLYDGWNRGNPRWGITVFVVFLYIWECLSCSTLRYLRNVVAPNEIKDHVNRVASAEPVITWHKEFYHYRTSWRRDSKGGMRSHRDKVVTHRSSRRYLAPSWKDNTTNNIDASIREQAGVSQFIKVTFAAIALLTDRKTVQNYFAQRGEFLLSERWRDEYMDDYTTMQIDGYLPKMLVKSTGISAAPFPGIMNTSFFFLFSLVGLTVPYRIWISRYCGHLRIVFEKEVVR